MKKQLGPSWNQQWPPHSLHLLAIIIISSCISICSAAPVHETTDLEQYSGTCYYNYNHYNEGDRILTNEPCLNCTCHNQMLMCYLRVCPFTKPIGHDCVVEKREDQCCPIITCPDVPVELVDHKTDSKTEIGFAEKYGCYIENKFYPEGAQVPSNPNKPCELCYCIRNRTSCLMQECTLHVDGCQPIYNRGVCCPVRYDCEHDTIMSGGPYLEDSHTTVRPTEGFILTTSPSIKDSSSCVANGVAYADGALIPDTKPCEHCYCMKGDIVCAVRECAIPMEFPDGKTCEYLPPAEGECCPESYVCKNDDGTVVYGNIADAEHEFTLPPQGDSIVTSTSSPAGLEEIEGPSATETSDGLHHKLHETVSEEDVQLQEHIDDIPKTSTVKTIEGGEEVVESDVATTAIPGGNIKLAQDNELSGADITTQTPESELHSVEKIEHDNLTEVPASATESPQPTSAELPTEVPHKPAEELPTEAPHKPAEEYEPVPVQTESSIETTYAPPSEIVPIAIPGEGDCLYNNVTHKNNTDVPNITKCDEHCICLSSIIKCRKVECVVALGANCRLVDSPDPNACCPTYVCDGEEPHKPYTGEELPAPTISSLSVDQEESTSVGIPESVEKTQVEQEHGQLPIESQTEHGLPDSLATESVTAALPEHPEHPEQLPEEHKEHEVEGTQKPEEADIIHHAEVEHKQPEDILDTQTVEQAIGEYDHTSGPTEAGHEIVTQEEEQLLTGHADADRKEEGELEHTELPIEKEPSVPQFSGEPIAPVVPSEFATTSAPVESYEGSTESYIEPTQPQKLDEIHVPSHGIESEETPESLPESTDAPKEQEQPAHEAILPEEPEPEIITAPEDSDLLQTTTELPALVHHLPETQPEEHLALPEKEKEPELEEPIETTEKTLAEPAPVEQEIGAGIETGAEQGAEIEQGAKLDHGAKPEEATETSLGADLGQVTESVAPALEAHEVEAGHADVGTEEAAHTDAPETSNVAEEIPSTDIGVAPESQGNQETEVSQQEPEIPHQEPEVIKEADHEEVQLIPETTESVSTEQQKPDLDRKHIRPEDIPELTETTLGPHIESMSHMTTAQPIDSEQPIEGHIAGENVPHIAEDDTAPHISSTEQEPAVGVSESSESAQTDLEPTEQPAQEVEGSGEIVQPELTPDQQSDADKELTTDELMSAVLEILKGTAAPQDEQTDIIYGTTEKGIEEPIKELQPAETPRPIESHDHTIAPEIAQQPFEDRTDVPHVDEDKLQKPIEGNLLPTDQPAEKPVGELEQTIVPEQELVEDAELPSQETPEVPALQEEHATASIDEIAQTTVPSTIKHEITPEVEGEQEHAHVPESLNVHHPTEDKEHIFDMIVDNLEGKTTVRPELGEEQQTVSVETGVQTSAEEIAPTQQTVPSQHADEQPEDIEMHTEHPVKHTELVGTVEQSTPTEIAPAQHEEYVPELPDHGIKPETSLVDKETIEQSTDGQRIAVTAATDLPTESIDAAKKHDEEMETATEIVGEKLPGLDESAGLPDDALDKVTESSSTVEHGEEMHATEETLMEEKHDVTIEGIEGTSLPSAEQTTDNQVLEEHVPEEHISGEHVTEGHISVEHVPEQEIPQEPTSQENFPHRHIPQEHIPEDHIPQEHIPQEHIPEEHTTAGQILEEHTTEAILIEEHATQEHASEEHVTESHISAEHIPLEHAPEEQTPLEHLPEEQIPQEHLPEAPVPEEQETTEQVPFEHIPDEHKSEQPIQTEHILKEQVPIELTPENLPEDITEQQPHIPGESLSQEPTAIAPEEPITQQPTSLPEEPISPEHAAAPAESITPDHPSATEQPIAPEHAAAPEEPSSQDHVAATEEPIAIEHAAPEEPISPELTAAPEEPISPEHAAITEESISSEHPAATEKPMASAATAIPEEATSVESTYAPEQNIPQDHELAPQQPISDDHVTELPVPGELPHSLEEQDAEAHTVTPEEEISEAEPAIPEAEQDVHIPEDQSTHTPEEHTHVPEELATTEASALSEEDVHIAEDKLPEEHLPEEHLPEGHLPEGHVPEEHPAKEHLPEEPLLEPSKPDSHIPSVQTTEEGSTSTYLEPEITEPSTTIASVSDELQPEEPEEININAIPESHTESEHLPESHIVDKVTEEPTPHLEITTSSVDTAIKEESSESVPEGGAPEQVDTLKTGDETGSTVQPAIVEEADKVEYPEQSTNVSPEKETSLEEATTAHAITEQKLPSEVVTEEDAQVIPHATESSKPEEVHIESEATTTKSEILEQKTESSPAAEDVTQKIVTTELVGSTTETYEAENKTEGHFIEQPAVPHLPTSASPQPQPTPPSHPLFPHRPHHPHHPQHPTSQESIDHIDHGSHPAPTHPGSGHFGPSGTGADSQGEGDFGPLPGGHYSSFGEDDYPEEEDPSAFGPGTCRYGGKLFVSAQQIPRDDPCDFCFCFRSDIICLQQSCPPPISGCHEEPIQGFCCPRYECPVLMGGVLNLTTTTTTTTTVPPHFHHRPSELIKRTGCYIGGQTYKVGEAIDSASGPCIQCSCGGDGQMKCEPKVCTPEPMLRQMIAVVASRRR